jgi:thiosulfate dehydrogenase [quinone] large subunit
MPLLTVSPVTATVRPSARSGGYGGPRSRAASQGLWTSGWVLLPLRVFLGVTFLYAGLQKLADPTFLAGSSPGSIRAQLLAATRTSPIGGWLGGLAHHPTAVGLGIALAEVAVGVGALLGLWTRIAAAGGMALSVGFLLAVSWHSHPYYLGPDIVFAAAWVPLVLAGAGDDPRLSLDGLLRQSSARALGLPPTRAVPIAFATVQRLCGGYKNGRCRYQRGRACGPEGCPVLAVPAIGHDADAVDLDRRAFLSRARVAGMLLMGGAVASALTAGVGRLLAGHGGGGGVAGLGTPNGSSTTSTSAPADGASAVRIGPGSAVPVGGVASFTDPASGDPAFVVQPTAGHFAAFSAVCPHAGCEVQFSQSANEFVCPCHGARFAATGSLLQGPATRPLTSITIAPGRDGQLYVDG